MKARWLICLSSVLLFGASQASMAACDQTLSVGANVASATASAPGGSTICLNGGNYGSVNFTNINRSAGVTLRSTSGIGATINANVANSRFITFQNLTIAGSQISACSRDIQIRDSTFTNGLLVTMRNAACTANLNLLVDGNTFGNLGPATYEGRLSVADDDGVQPSMGLTISNNKFGPGCQSDGIQLVGGATGVMIGPGNIFDGINQSGSVHCDMIQFYASGANNTINGNWFRNGSTVLTHHSATNANTHFTNNILSNVSQIQVNGSVGFVFEHNTIYNVSDVFQLNSEAGGSVVSRSNVIIGRGPSTTGGSTSVSYHLCQLAGSCSGANQMIGAPTFVGGSLPTTWAGWALAAGSMGKNAGHDGRDRGTTYFGAAGVAPEAPVNLTAQ